ncbi:MAG: endonuclease/exonuclease/phosphatase family protein [Planctomycetota bacterium]
MPANPPRRRGPFSPLRHAMVALVALTCSLGCDGPTAAQPGAEAQATPATVTVASWNIEWLGTPDKRRPPGEGHLQQVDHLAAYMAASDADVIVLQEVAVPWLSVGPNGEPPALAPPRSRTTHLQTFTNPILDAVCAAMNAQEAGADWRHAIFPARGRSIVHCTGVMWNQAVLTPQGEPRPLFEEERTPMVRPPWAAAFSTGEGKTDFVVVSVHFKAGDANAQRHDEALAILERLDRLVDDGDVVVIGDTNSRSTQDPAIRAFNDAGWQDLNQANQSTLPTGRYGLDRALIPQDQPEFAGSRQQVLAQARLDGRVVRGDAFRRLLSDHLMIVTTLRTMDDDD